MPGAKARLLKFKLITRPETKKAFSILFISFFKASPKGVEGFTLFIELFNSCLTLSLASSLDMFSSAATASNSSSVAFSSITLSRALSTFDVSMSASCAVNSSNSFCRGAIKASFSASSWALFTTASAGLACCKPASSASVFPYIQA